MKKLGLFFAALVVALLTFTLWMTRSWPFNGIPEPEVVSWEQAAVEQDAILVEGTAHFALRASITRGASLGREERVLWLYPLMPKGDLNTKRIKIMVVSEQEPDRHTTFQDMHVSGWALPPSAAMTNQIEEMFAQRGYVFTDDYFVLEQFPVDAQATP